MSDTYYFRADRLREAADELCRGSGSPEDEARLLAQRLVKSDLTGHPSHGVIRLPMYMGMVRRELLQPGVRPTVSKDHGATAVVDGHRAYGQVAAEFAMQMAIERGRRHGVAAVGVTNLGHIGRLADYAVCAAEAGCIGMVFTSGGGGGVLVAPFGGSSRRMSTNPMAMAFPSDREFPVVFDMATSVWAEGKLRVLRAASAKAPADTLLNSEGQPSVDPEEFYAGGAILPLGGKQGYKGYLLNFAIEVLAGLLTGGGYVGRDKDPVFNNCTLMTVVDVSRFRESSDFKSELEDLIRYLKESPAQAGQEVLWPGEVEARNEAQRLKSGIPLAVRTVEAIQEEMDRYGVPGPLAERGRKTPFA